jgi:hypothetical protein
MISPIIKFVKFFSFLEDKVNDNLFLILSFISKFDFKKFKRLYDIIKRKEWKYWTKMITNLKTSKKIQIRMSITMSITMPFIKKINVNRQMNITRLTFIINYLDNEIQKNNITENQIILPDRYKKFSCLTYFQEFQEKWKECEIMKKFIENKEKEKILIKLILIQLYCKILRLIYIYSQYNKKQYSTRPTNLVRKPKTIKQKRKYEEYYRKENDRKKYKRIKEKMRKSFIDIDKSLLYDEKHYITRYCNYIFDLIEIPFFSLKSPMNFEYINELPKFNILYQQFYELFSYWKQKFHEINNYPIRQLEIQYKQLLYDFIGFERSLDRKLEYKQNKLKNFQKREIRKEIKKEKKQFNSDINDNTAFPTLK